MTNNENSLIAVSYKYQSQLEASMISDAVYHCVIVRGSQEYFVVLVSWYMYLYVFTQPLRHGQDMTQDKS